MYRRQYPNTQQSPYREYDTRKTHNTEIHNKINNDRLKLNRYIERLQTEVKVEHHIYYGVIGLCVLSVAKIIYSLLEYFRSRHKIYNNPTTMYPQSTSHERIVQLCNNTVEIIIESVILVFISYWLYTMGKGWITWIFLGPFAILQSAHILKWILQYFKVI